jgi:DNA N-6-adenine-methyltransferase Dam
MTLGSHQRYVGKSQVYVTPKVEILDRLGPFDFDPCAMTPPRPWACAKVNITEKQDGLKWRWPPGKRCYLNPPFDQRVVGAFIEKLAAHGIGTLLTHARTEAGWFEPIWQKASGILFLADRIFFYLPNGERCAHNSGAPAILASFGVEDLRRLRESGIAGTLITSWERVDAKAPLPWKKWEGHPGMVIADLPDGGGYYTWEADGVIRAAYSRPWRSPYPVGKPPGPPRLMHPINKPTYVGSAPTLAEVQVLCERHHAGRTTCQSIA